MELADVQNGDFVFKGAGPCAKHCRAYLKTLVKTGKSTNNIAAVRNRNAQPLSCEAALLLLIPRWGADVLPAHLRTYMDHADLVHWYPKACTACDDFRAKRKTQAGKWKARERDIRRNTCAGAVAKWRLGALNRERRAFEEVYLAHVRSAHPVLPPPVKVVRRLLKKGAAGSKK